MFRRPLRRSIVWRRDQPNLCEGPEPRKTRTTLNQNPPARALVDPRMHTNCLEFLPSAIRADSCRFVGEISRLHQVAPSRARRFGVEIRLHGSGYTWPP